MVKHRSLYLTKKKKKMCMKSFIYLVCLHQGKNSRFRPAHLNKKMLIRLIYTYYRYCALTISQSIDHVLL